MQVGRIENDRLCITMSNFTEKNEDMKQNGNKTNSGTTIWDAYRLAREYVKIAWMANDSIPSEKLSWDNQIRVRRVALVICAYLILL